jgi:hypothetical protein
MTNDLKRVAVKLTQEQLAEINIAYNKFVKDEKFEEEYVNVCLKHGYKPIDKRKEKLYDDNDNSSRVGFSYCCYNHEKGKYFQNVLKIMIRTALSNAHKLIVGKDGLSYEDSRLTYLDKFAKEFIRERMGNHDGGIQYKKDFSNQSIDIMLWFANNDTNFRAKLLTLINTFSDKKTLFQLTEVEDFNSKKFG